MDTPVTVRAALLQALTQGEGYGLALIERVLYMTQGRVALGQGSIYPALRDLEEEGLVRSRSDGFTDRAGRPRRYFHLTAQGRKNAETHRETVAHLFGLGLL